MNIKITPCIAIDGHLNNGFYDIYYEYQKELRVIDTSIKDDPIETESGLIEHEIKCLNYIDAVIYDNTNPVGIISYQNINWLDDGKPNILYIDQFYIMPEYRQKGYGKTAISKMKEIYKGYTVFLYILNQNNVAKTFWEHTLLSIGYKNTHDARCCINNEIDAIKTSKKVIVR